ncbi:MAG TPA: endonuclease/exonuclease/phosphatase family protein [Actinomycetota bacterium]
MRVVEVLTVALLAQAARVAFPLLYDVREDTGAGIAVLWALAAFVAVPPMAAAALRRVDPPVGIGAAVVALAVARVALQLVDPIPLWLAALAVAVGLTALTLEFERSRTGRASFATSVVLGLAIDATILGIFETWDPAWQTGPAATAAGILLPVAAVGSVIAGRRGEVRASPEGAPWAAVLVGPFLLVHVPFLHNVAFVTSETGLSVAVGTVLILVGDALALVAAAGVLARSDRAAAIAAGGVAVAGVAVLALVDGPPVGVVVPIASAAAGTSLAVATAPAAPGAAPAWRTHAWFALGAALFVGGAFAYQIDVDAPLPIPRSTFPIVAAALVGAGAFRRHEPTRRSNAVAAVPLAGAVVVSVLLLSPVDDAEAPGATLRIVSWNIHTAVDDAGQVVLDDVLDTIRRQSPDVVILQEVGRGWPIAGQADDLEWLARHLGMSSVWAPAADGQFGNAILTSAPVELDRVLALPYGEGPQLRSALGAVVGGEAPLLVVDAHLQNGDRASTRRRQVEAILAVWGDRTPLVLAGDLNMQPEEEHVRLLEAAGLVSAQDAIGDPADPTARDPLHPGDRVDWIWVSPELEMTRFEIVRSDASDHLPLVLDVVAPNDGADTAA